MRRDETQSQHTDKWTQEQTHHPLLRHFSLSFLVIDTLHLVANVLNLAVDILYFILDTLHSVIDDRDFVVHAVCDF